MCDSACPAETLKFKPNSGEVIAAANAFIFRVESPSETAILRCHPCRAAIGVATLRLNATDREQRSPADVHHVAAKRNRAERCFGHTQFPGANKDNVVCDARFRKGSVDPGEPPAERKSDVIGKGQRRCSGAALSTIDRDEVRTATCRSHFRREFSPKLRLAHCRLDPNGHTSDLGQLFNKRDETVDIGKCGVGCRALARNTNRDSSNCGNLGSDLVGRKQPSETRLRPLTELDFNRPNRRCLHLFDSARKIE